MSVDGEKMFETGMMTGRYRQISHEINQTNKHTKRYLYIYICYV